MHNFKYIKISNKKRIRILSLSTKSKLYVLFLHGFKSDIELNNWEIMQPTGVFNDGSNEQ